MVELTESHFRELCADAAVRRIIDEADRSGRRAAIGFWAVLLLGFAMIAAATIIAINLDHLILAVLIGSIGVLAVYCIAMIPLVVAGRAIKLPVFEILAARHGMDYAPLVGAPPVYAEAGPILFGDELATESFVDFFHGKFLDACDFTTCQSYILGENETRFNGRLFTLARHRGGGGHVIATPDNPHCVDPATALALDGDPAFARAFRVHATIAEEGRALLGPEARRTLLELRRRGKVWLYAGPGEILVAVQGRKGFTPGLGFRFRRGEDRIRAMFDDLADSLATLRSLKASLDGGL
jgi:hypothetical protein